MIFNRFAKEARRCVEAALEEARALGHDSVGDEDLLLGVLRAGEGEAAEALSFPLWPSETATTRGLSFWRRCENVDGEQG